MASRFTDVRFAEQYPRHDVAENEVLMSFRNDEDALAFREWWGEAGNVAFGEWAERTRDTRR